ncbi:MAG: phosphatidylglycerophosphatase A, partial [Burkholderiales bacterium]
MTDRGQSAGLRPAFAFLMSHPAHFIALGFGTGLAPVAPG